MVHCWLVRGYGSKRCIYIYTPKKWNTYSKSHPEFCRSKQVPLHCPANVETQRPGRLQNASINFGGSLCILTWLIALSLRATKDHPFFITLSFHFGRGPSKWVGDFCWVLKLHFGPMVFWLLPFERRSLVGGQLFWRLEKWHAWL